MWNLTSSNCSDYDPSQEITIIMDGEEKTGTMFKDEGEFICDLTATEETITCSSEGNTIFTHNYKIQENSLLLSNKEENCGYKFMAVD